ncbi:hypothetical protein G1ANC_00072 [Candidatus Nanosynsacchari sp. TM7_ANC_38.39_G1_1]|nr:hypothetical protein G1ANC_00072 [Candidatus Nanosynsacchari sp. TM7_ANC_38.39_G1_1]
MVSVSNIIVAGGVAVAAALTVLVEVYVAACVATYIEPVLAARWAARTAARAARAREDWLDTEQAVREASLAVWTAWGFESRAVKYYTEAWAEAQASADRARSRAQRAQARANKARAWAIRANKG